MTAQVVVELLVEGQVDAIILALAATYVRLLVVISGPPPFEAGIQPLAELIAEIPPEFDPVPVRQIELAQGRAAVATGAVVAPVRAVAGAPGELAAQLQRPGRAVAPLEEQGVLVGVLPVGLLALIGLVLIAGGELDRAA